MVVTDITLMGSRTLAFARDGVLQEIMILKADKILPMKRNQQYISIVYIDATGKSHNPKLHVRYDVALAAQNQGVRLQIPKSQTDLRVLRGLSRHGNTVETLGFRVRTGEVVPFRCRDMLRYENDKGSVPLIWMSDVCAKSGSTQKGRAKPGFIDTGAKPVFKITHNIALVRRFSAGDCGIKVIAEEFIKRPGGPSQIGIENHVNYIIHPNFPDDYALVRGLVVYLNSTPVQAFFKCMCGTTQVSAHDLRALPVPSLEGLRRVGLDKSSAEECIGLVENEAELQPRGVENVAP